MNKTEINLMDLVRGLLSHIVIILLAGALVGAAAWAYTTYKIPKMYRTSVTFFAKSKDDTQTDTAITPTIQSADRQLANTYSYVFCSNVVMKEAAAKLDEMGIQTPAGNKYSYAALKAMTSVSTTNTEIFTITFSSTDKDNLQTIANTVSEVGADMIKDIVGGEARLLDAAEKPGAPYSPNVRGNTISGIAIGLLVAAAIVIIRMLTDTTIWTEEDLSKQYKIPVLGSVPQLSMAEKQTAGKE